MNFQEIIKKLNEYWAKQGVLIGQPYGVEVGAGTANPHTFFRVLGPEPFSVAYVEPSRRPADGRYGENPNRLQHYFQYQIILKPAPYNHIQLYLDMLTYLGIDLTKHDIRFVEDNWASPSLRAWGLGWEIWLDSMEVTQYTYFQQMGGINLEVPTVEITLGLERLAMYINDIDDYKDIPWNQYVTYGDIFQQHEYYQSKYNFEEASVDTLKQLLDLYRSEATRLIKKGNFWAAYDFVLRMSHIFNILDARGAVSDAFRRELFKQMGEYLSNIAKLYIESRSKMGYPLLKSKEQSQNEPFVADTTEKAIVANKVKKTEMLTYKEAINESGRLPVLSELRTFASHSIYKHLGEDFDIDKALVLVFVIEDLPDAVLQMIKQRITSNYLGEIFKKYGLGFSAFYPVITPTQIGFILKDARIIKSTKKVIGPPVKIAFDNNRPSEVMKKLLSKYGEALQKYEIENEKVVFHLKNTLDFSEFMKQAYKSIFSDIPYMHMRLNERNVIRPLLSYIYTYNGKLIDINQPDVLGNIRSANVFVMPKWLNARFVKLKKPHEWLDLNFSLGIILNPDDRAFFIKRQVEDFISNNSKSRNNLDLNATEEHYEILAMLTSSPRVYFQEIPKKFNDLPNFIIDYVLWVNQKYIVLQNRSRSNVSSYTAVVTSDNPLESAETNVLKGALKVLTARLDDALFYFNRDKSLTYSRLEDLTSDKYLGPALGTLKDKRERLSKLADALLGESKTLYYSDDRGEIFTNKFYKKLKLVLKYIKLDLVTELGKEFPDLEGKIISEYIINQAFSLFDTNVDQDVYKALHMFNDINQSNIFGLFILLFDKLDDLLKLIEAKGLPKGNSDPYGIKSRADIIIQILIKLFKHYNLNTNIKQLLNITIALPYYNVELNQMIDFLNRRLDNYISAGAGFLDHNAVNSDIYLRAIIYSEYEFIAEKVVNSNLIVEQLFNNKEYLEIIKRIQNIIRKNNSLIKGLSILKNRKQFNPNDNSMDINKNSIHGEGAQILNKINQLLKAYLIVKKYLFVSSIQSFLLKNTDLFKQILNDTSNYLDKYRIINDDKDVTINRLKLLLFVQDAINLFVNIPVLLNQV